MRRQAQKRCLQTFSAGFYRKAAVAIALIFILSAILPVISKHDPNR